MKKADVYLWNKVMDALNDIENETDADDVDGWTGQEVMMVWRRSMGLSGSFCLSGIVE